MLAHIPLLAIAGFFASAQLTQLENFDPECSPDMQPGFETDIVQFNVPIQTFFNATGTYFGSVWYTGPLISTTGEDDTIGATRTGNFSGTIFRERLVDISQTPDRFMHRFTLDNGPISFFGVSYSSYTEEMVVQGICQGTATWVSFTDKYCADDATSAFSIYRRSRRTLMDALADKMGARYLEGSCPIGKSCLISIVIELSLGVLPLCILHRIWSITVSAFHSERTSCNPDLSGKLDSPIPLSDDTQQNKPQNKHNQGQKKQGGGGGKPGGGGQPSAKLRGLEKDSPAVRLSKTLSWLLRHGAKSEGLPMRPDGYVKVIDLLENPKLKGQGLDLLGLQEIVKADAKKRYDLTEDIGVWWIKANQGHSIKTVKLELRPILSVKDIPTGVAVHGTTRAAWDLISQQGLSKMKRNHIHFAQGVPGDGVISGMRKSSQVLIYLDVQKVLDAGIELFFSDNGVVLSEGRDGIILPEFFQDVQNANGQSIPGWKATTGLGEPIVESAPIPLVTTP
ncbi:hypothetical protein H0H87_002631 [Tephrocybe sp. NHM501043]|nr:hypothetical protein H0H87_002631 [Tephrocybe sp. NHM501043]